MRLAHRATTALRRLRRRATPELPTIAGWRAVPGHIEYESVDARLCPHIFLRIPVPKQTAFLARHSVTARCGTCGPVSWDSARQ